MGKCTCFSVALALAVSGVCVRAGTITYDFNDGTLGGLVVSNSLGFSDTISGGVLTLSNPAGVGSGNIDITTPFSLTGDFTASVFVSRPSIGNSEAGISTGGASGLVNIFFSRSNKLGSNVFRPSVNTVLDTFNSAVAGTFSITRAGNDLTESFDDGSGSIVSQTQNSATFAGSVTANLFLLEEFGDSGGHSVSFDNFTITGAGVPAANLTWNNNAATGDGVTWDTTSQNWHNGSSPTIFHSADNVTFNDSNYNHYNVTLNTTVSPGSILFANNAGNYTFSGTGAIAGTAVVTINGSATVTFATANTYSGATTINSGTLLVTNLAGSATGSSSVTLNGGTLGGSGTISGAVIGGSGPHTIAPSATLPGTSATTLKVGALTTSPDTSLVLNLVTPGDSSVSDHINVTTANGLTFNGGDLQFPNHPTGAASLGYYRIIQYSGTINGAGLSSIALPSTVNNIAYTLDTSHSFGFIDVHRGLLGDANDDGVVNFADFVLLSNHFGASGAGWGGGDFNGDGVTNFSDFVILSNDFGATIGASEGAGFVAGGVPEPGTLGVMGAGMLVWGRSIRSIRRIRRAGDGAGTR